MIVIDLSQILWSQIHGSHMSNSELSEDLIRHMVLNSLRKFRLKFGKQYGELVIAMDGRNYWRKEINPYYKGNRAKARKKSKLDMNLIFSAMDNIKQELNDVFPYTCIEVDTCEADDVVGVLARYRSGNDNPMIIISSDHDFQQLHQYPGVCQYSPMAKKLIVCEMPVKDYIKQHICIGDSGDGVANMFSDIDTFEVDGKRQKSVYKKDIARWVNMSKEEICADTGVSIERYELNERQVDLSFTPQKLVDQILEKSDAIKKTPMGGFGQTILSYFVKHRMKIMMDSLPEFVSPVKKKIEKNTEGLESFF
ncbi:MAG: hypothetical protein R8M45_03665 [Ghiorsea sp.]